MKALRNLWLLSLLLVLGMNVGGARAQGVSSLGTDFWFGFMPNYLTPASNTTIYIASGTENTVVIETYGGSASPSSRIVKLTKNEAKTISLVPTIAETRVTEEPVYQAVHVTSTNPLAVYGYSNAYATSDGFLALPTPGLGTEYLAGCWPDDYYWSPSEPLAGEFLIVAPFDETRVTITIKGNTRLDQKGIEIGHRTNDVWSVDLKKGQTYLVQSVGTEIAANDLTGSQITSNKPIGFLSGHQRCSIPIGAATNSKDHLIEMLPPLDRWGTQYFDVPEASRVKAGNLVRVLSGEDGNTITYNGKGPFVLNKGEYADVEYQTEATVYTSTNKKKFLLLEYSYTQGEMGDPSGSDPFMMVVTPQEQFQKKILFRTPTNSDPGPSGNGSFTHYLTVVSQSDSVSTIRLSKNGVTKSLQSWGGGRTPDFTGINNPKMAAWRVQIGSEEATYLLQSEVKFGAYLYGYTQVESYGWPTGMALAINSPDTLPPLASPVENCGDFTVGLKEVRHIPNFTFEDTRIAEVNLITDPNDLRWSKPSFNYDFKLSNNFTVGDSTTTFTLTVLDLTKDAYAAVWTVDRAGNDTVYEYTYQAPKLTVTEPTNIYDPVIVQSDSCRIIKIKNTQATGNIHLTAATLIGTPQGGKFTVTPKMLDAILKPGEETSITVCYNPSDTGVRSIDSLRIQTECVPFIYALEGLGVTPLIYAEDLNFGYVSTGQTVCKDLKITNPGTSQLRIGSQDLQVTNTEFSIDPAIVFPIILNPGASTTIKFCFHPTTDGTKTVTILYGTNNPIKFLHSIKDTSRLIGISATPGAKLSVITKDFGAVSCLDKASYVDTLYNDGGTTADIKQVGIEGSGAYAYSITNFTSPSLKNFILQPRPGFIGYEYTVQFDPNAGPLDGLPRTARLYAETQDGTRRPLTELSGSRKAPILSNPTAATPLDFGTLYIGNSAPASFAIKNTGTDLLTVTALTVGGADAANFTVLTATPFDVAVGASKTIDVQFTAGNTAKKYVGNIDIIPAKCAAPVAQPVTGQSSSNAYVALGASYGDIFVCKDKQLPGSFQNGSSMDNIMLTDVRVGQDVGLGWLNDADFSLVAPWTPRLVAPSETVPVPVLFAPTGFGPRTAALIFTFTTRDSNGNDAVVVEKRELVGNGLGIPQILGVGNTTTGGNYTGFAGDVIDVPIKIGTQFQDRDNVKRFGFDVNFKRDAFSAKALNNLGAATATFKSYDAVSDMETYAIEYNSATLFSGTNDVVTLPLTVMLTTSGTSPIAVSNAHYFDPASGEICYIQTEYIPGNFSLQTSCERTIQKVLGHEKLDVALGSVSPNPARTNADIVFAINQNDIPVSLRIYDALGNEAATVLNTVTLRKGSYVAHFDVTKLASGTYFCRLSDGKSTMSKPIIVQK